MLYAWYRINQIGNAISKPGAFIHHKVLDVIYTDVVEMFLVRAVYCLSIIVWLFEAFFERNTFRAVVLAIALLILDGAFVGLISILVPFTLKIISGLTAPFAYINNRCQEKLYEELSDEPYFQTSDGRGIGPNAVVGIRYFIEMEKKNSKTGFYKAKYIGK